MTDQQEPAVSLFGLVSDALKDGAGVSEADAERLAREMCRYLAARYAGRRIYVAASVDGASIRERVRAEFNGRNLAEIQQRFGLSRSTIYRYAGKKFEG